MNDDGNPYASPGEVGEEPVKTKKTLPWRFFVVPLILSILPTLLMSWLCFQSLTDGIWPVPRILVHYVLFAGAFTGLCLRQTWALFLSLLFPCFVLKLTLEDYFFRVPPPDIGTSGYVLVGMLIAYCILMILSCLGGIILRFVFYRTTPEQ